MVLINATVAHRILRWVSFVARLGQEDALGVSLSGKNEEQKETRPLVSGHISFNLPRAVLVLIRSGNNMLSEVIYLATLQTVRLIDMR